MNFVFKIADDFGIINYKEIFSRTLQQNKLIKLKIKEELDSFCKTIGYKHVGSCSKCYEVIPKQLQPIFEKDTTSNKKFEKLLDSPTKLRRMYKKLSIGNLICLNYSNEGKGLIFSQEYYMEKSKKPITIEKPLEFSLGPINYFSYGDLDGKEEEIFDERNCRERLGIPEKLIIRSVDQTQITERLKINLASLFQQV
jgi:hypothetical protein